MPQIPAYSFCSFSGTGKTTFLEKLIRELKSRGIRVAVVKHDAHNCFIDQEGKDTWRFFQAGADITVFSSDKQLAFLVPPEPDLENIFGRICGVDLILTEGYQTGTLPKIALYRKASGNELPLQPRQCLAIVSDTPFEAPCPVFGLDDVKGVADFLLSRTDKKGNSI